MFKQLSDDSIRASIENNLHEFFITCAQHSSMESHIKDDLSWIFPKNADWPSGIFRANLKKNQVETKVKEIISLIKQNKIPNSWKIGPSSRPINLEEILISYGFKRSFQQSGMAIDLKNLEGKIKSSSVLQVSVVEDLDCLNKWIDIVSKVFDINVDFELIKFLLDQDNLSLFVGFLEKENVSACLLYLTNQTASLHAVSTIPEHRGKSFGYEISRIALNKAIERGYRIAGLQASALGEFVYKNLGFEKCFDINSYSLEF